MGKAGNAPSAWPALSEAPHEPALCRGPERAVHEPALPDMIARRILVGAVREPPVPSGAGDPPCACVRFIQAAAALICRNSRHSLPPCDGRQSARGWAGLSGSYARLAPVTE